MQPFDVLGDDVDLEVDGVADALGAEDGAGEAKEDPRIASLTPREREILVLMAQGMSNAEIADHLVVSSTTVKTHVSHLMKKYDVPSRLKLVVAVHKTQGA